MIPAWVREIRIQGAWGGEAPHIYNLTLSCAGEGDTGGEVEKMKRQELDILLKEYETCHKEGHSSSVSYWTIFGIFLSVITVISAYIIKNILDANNDILNSNSNERWIIFGLSLFALLIIFFLFL
ncbi:hypothetical protein ACFLVN_00230 [Chloroflexota bacterium]